LDDFILRATREGRLFSGTAAATGLVLPIYSATAQLFGLWNPANSGVNAFLVSVRLGYVDTTGAAGGFVWGLLRDAGSNVATAAPISAFTDTTPERGLVGTAKGGNRVRFTGSAATVTTGLMVLGEQLGLNQLVLTAADATNPVFTVAREYRGETAITPGTALFLCGNISTLSKWVPTVKWVEEKAA
jgi:hypothetical protein